MVEYRDIKKPESLKAVPVTLADLAVMERAEGPTAIATDLGDGHATQLNVKHADGRTFVIPIGGVVEPFAFGGYIAPRDVRTWYRAKYGPQE